MDLRYSDAQESFRADARAWLRANVPNPPLQTPGTREGFEAHRGWERALHGAGYSGLQWPEAYGGRGADVVSLAIFEEEYFLAGGPERINALGQRLMGPTLMVHGTEEQKHRWLRRILAADDVWSQGFSEPDAGSDLAGLKTRAVRDGDDFVINGQKIWTSYGAFADWMFALVRTDPDAPRHAGITFLALDMRSEGVEVSPLVQLDGHVGFAQVFFTDVRVPAAQVIGEINRGWEVAMTTLGFERDAPSASPAIYLRYVQDVLAAARARGLDADPRVMDGIAGLYADARAYQAHALRTLTRQARGESIGPEASMTKLIWSEMGHRLAEVSRDVYGPHAEVRDADDPLAPKQRWHYRYWISRAATIYAGTSEIQRNIVSERVLGLPKG